MYYITVHYILLYCIILMLYCIVLHYIILLSAPIFIKLCTFDSEVEVIFLFHI